MKGMTEQTVPASMLAPPPVCVLVADLTCGALIRQIDSEFGAK